MCVGRIKIFFLSLLLLLSICHRDRREGATKQEIKLISGSVKGEEEEEEEESSLPALDSARENRENAQKSMTIAHV